eukprot:gene6905-8240_t
MTGFGAARGIQPVLALLALLGTIKGDAAPTDYAAAAVQYTDQSSVRNSATDNLQINWNNFASLAANAKAEGAQIIVFPEAVLWSIAFKSVNPRDTIRNYGETLPSNSQIIEDNLKMVPCENKGGLFEASPSVRNASCIARAHNIAVVYNTVDVQSCNPKNDPDCPKDGRYQFNTDVALDTDGALLAVYHKVHIFGTSPALNEPRQPDVVSFETSFGVIFGLFICFDIEFMSPSMQLIARGIRDFAYSTSWVNQPPILTAQMVQQAWSRKYSSNLIAANNGVSFVKSGGGIYSSGEVLAEFFNSTGTNVTSKSGLHCSLDARVSRADSLFVLGALVTTGHFPGTPDPLAYELCSVF